MAAIAPQQFRPEAAREVLVQVGAGEVVGGHVSAHFFLLPSGVFLGCVELWPWSWVLGAGDEGELVGGFLVLDWVDFVWSWCSYVAWWCFVG